MQMRLSSVGQLNSGAAVPISSCLKTLSKFTDVVGLGHQPVQHVATHDTLRCHSLTTTLKMLQVKWTSNNTQQSFTWSCRHPDDPKSFEGISYALMDYIDNLILLVKPQHYFTCTRGLSAKRCIKNHDGFHKYIHVMLRVTCCIFPLLDIFAF